MGDSDDVLKQLDSTIEAIETHRDWRAQQREEEEQRLNADWEQILKAATQLRSRLSDNERLRYFSIARDGSEVAVSFHARSGGGSHLLSLHRRHPDGKFPMTNVFWCRSPGRDDRRFSTAKEAVDCLVKHCAGNLTSPGS